MLCWPCDLIIAADNAEFSDPTARMGLAGVEYMAHTWEFGPRKAKELLFRSTAIGAEEALALGMVNKVVPLEDLRDEAMTGPRHRDADPMMTRLVSAASTPPSTPWVSGVVTTASTSRAAHGSRRRCAANFDVRPTNILEHMRATNEHRGRQAAGSGRGVVTGDDVARGEATNRSTPRRS
jgi:hypothetical protein